MIEKRISTTFLEYINFQLDKLNIGIHVELWLWLSILAVGFAIFLGQRFLTKYHGQYILPVLVFISIFAWHWLAFYVDYQQLKRDVTQKCRLSSHVTTYIEPDQWKVLPLNQYTKVYTQAKDEEGLLLRFEEQGYWFDKAISKRLAQYQFTVAMNNNKKYMSYARLLVDKQTQRVLLKEQGVFYMQIHLYGSIQGQQLRASNVVFFCDNADNNETVFEQQRQHYLTD